MTLEIQLFRCHQTMTLGTVGSLLQVFSNNIIARIAKAIKPSRRTRFNLISISAARLTRI